jgi:hypothetical protein
MTFVKVDTACQPRVRTDQLQVTELACGHEDRRRSNDARRRTDGRGRIRDSLRRPAATASVRPELRRPGLPASAARALRRMRMGRTFPNHVLAARSTRRRSTPSTAG